MKEKKGLEQQGSLKINAKVKSPLPENESARVAILESPFLEEEDVALAMVEAPLDESVGVALVELPLPETKSVGAIMEIELMEDDSPLHDEIAALAYSYWEDRGRQGGSPEADWFRAEGELRGQRNSEKKA
jgi:hypothetical protein